MLKVCVVGAGAIGGFLGTRLAASGGARSRRWRAAQRSWRCAIMAGGWRKPASLTSAPAALACDDPRELGPQDLVILALKATALPALAPTLRPLIAAAHAGAAGDERRALVVQRRHRRAAGRRRCRAWTRTGSSARRCPTAQVIGCVVHASAATRAPGLAVHGMGQRLIVGEPGGGESERVRSSPPYCARHALRSICSPRIRYDIWYKLWGNMTLNPLSALTGATMDRVLAMTCCAHSVPRRCARRPWSATASAAR